MTNGFLIYGATGYTGRLIARAAARRGLQPILAGRRRDRLQYLAGSLGLSAAAFPLDDPRAMDAALANVAVVLNAAGPFSATAAPMIDACLRTGTHYLDVTGEIDVLEACFERDAEARRTGIAVLPGVGFDVVPSDCLAAHMKRRLPSATSLTLAISGLSGLSRGTALTGIEGIGQGTRVRRGGRIVTLSEPLRRQIDYGDGPVPSVAVSWGDVATAYHSTGIPDIAVFFQATGAIGATMRIGSAGRRLLATRPARALLRRLVRLMPAGPSDEDRAAAPKAVLIGEAADATGAIARSRLETLDGYSLTVLTSLAAVERVVAGGVEPGVWTPSQAFGADFILEIQGSRRDDL